MPNWCSNTLMLEHADPAQIERAVNAYKRGELLNEFCPCPAELREADAKLKAFANAEVKSDNMTKFGYESWYDWSIAHWGTKWDVGSDHGPEDYKPGDTEVFVYFDSAWAPPIAGMEQLESAGFNVELYYWEPGMAFCGKYESGSGDQHIDYSQMTSEQAAEAIPEDVNEVFDIVNSLYEYEQATKDMNHDSDGSN
jgi:hypothetical protein